MREALLIAERDYNAITRNRSFLFILVGFPLFLYLLLIPAALLSEQKGYAYAIFDQNGAYDATLERAIQDDNHRRLNLVQSAVADPQTPTTAAIASEAHRLPADRSSPGTSSPDPTIAKYGQYYARTLASASLFRGGEPGKTPVSPDKLGKTVATKAGLRQLTFAILVPRDFGHGGRASVWTTNVDPHLPSIVESALARELNSTALSAAGVNPQIVDGVRHTAVPVNVSVIAPSAKLSDRLRDFAPSIFSFLLLVTVTLTGTMMMQSLVEERSSRLLEGVLSVTTPRSIMLGKLIGICGVGFTFGITWFLISVGAVLFMPSGAGDAFTRAFAIFARPDVFAASLFYYASGYLAISMIFLIIGVVSRSQRDAQAYMMPLSIFLLAPASIVSLSPPGPLHDQIANVMAWIPIYTPFEMIRRVSLTVPAWEVLATSAWLLIFIAAELWLLDRLFQKRLLQTASDKSS